MDAVVFLRVGMIRSHEGPQTPALGKEDAVAHRQIALTRIHHLRWSPRFAAIIAHLHVRLLGGCVFFSTVEAIRRVEPTLVPGETDTERETALVRVWPLILDDMKLRTGRLGQFGGSWERSHLVPKRKPDHLRHIVRGGYRSVTCCDLLCLQRTGFQSEFIQSTGERLAHLVCIPDAAKCDGSLGARDRRFQPHLARRFAIEKQGRFLRIDHQSHPMPCTGLQRLHA